MRRSTYGLLAAGLALLFAVPCPVSAQTLHFPRERPADIEHIKLELGVDIPAERVEATATIKLRALRDLSTITLDAVDFDIRRVVAAVDGNEPASAAYQYDGEEIDVALPATLKRGQSASLVIDYLVHQPADGLFFFAPTDEEPDVPYMVWSQGEAITNRHWFPSFDHPNEMQTTELIVTAQAGNEVVSNGRMVEKRENADGTVTFHWLQDKPHVSYLVTLVVGPFHVEQETWRGRPVTYYVPAKDADKVQTTFGNTVPMLEYFSTVIGVEYPWDKYAQVCAEQFGGGMENTSATTLTPGTLHDERAHLDHSSDGLIAHELAHQWYGDLLTCSDWAHLWLNEGFASYFEAVWFEHHLGQDEYDLEIYGDMGRGYRGGKDRPVVDRGYENPGQMFDSRAYPKGASILHMLRTRVGDEMFWRCIREYTLRNAYQSVETSDLRKAFEDVSGQSLGRFFYDWTERPGAPEVSVDYTWQSTDNVAELLVRQKQEADAFHFPLRVDFYFSESAEPVVRTWEITEKEQRLYLPLPEAPSMVLVDPEQAVLTDLAQKKGRELWARQLTEAPRMVNRIRAAQFFGKSNRSQDVDLLADALQSERFWGVADHIARALGEAGGDAARDALLVGAAHEHPKVRSACLWQLDSFHGDQKVIDAVRTMIEKGDPSYRVEASAVRTYGRLGADDAKQVLASVMDRESYREQIRTAALSGIGSQFDASGMEVLLEWSRAGKPRACRMTAIAAMSTLARDVDLEAEAMERIVEAATAALARGEHRRMKSTALRTLGSLGDDARLALPVLQGIAANDREERVRRAAKEAIDQIRSDKPAQVQLQDVRKELEELREENKRIKEQLEKLEQLQSVPVPEPQELAKEPAAGAAN